MLRMSPQEKLAKGMPLTSNDFQILLTDPNSPYYKELQAQEAQASLMKSFINMLNFIFDTISRLTREQELNEIELANDPRHLQAQTNPVVLTPQEKAERLRDLQEGMRHLLDIDISTFSAARLTLHHNQLMANFSAQVATSLGLSTAPAPIPSAAQILSVNKGLDSYLAANPDLQESFAKVHTLSATGPLLVFATYRIQQNEKGEELDISGAELLKALRRIDLLIDKIQKENPDFVEKGIGKTNQLLVEKHYQPSLGKHPALHAPRPDAGVKKLTEEEQAQAKNTTGKKR